MATKKTKRLTKGSDRMLLGVCSGIATYIDIDPTVIRLLWIITTLLTGFVIGIAAYILAGLIMPEK